MNKLILIFLFFTVNLYSQNLDIEISKKVNKFPESQSDGLFRFISNSESYILIAIPTSIIIIGGIEHNDDIVKNGGMIAISTVVNLGVTTITKYIVKRKRPFNEYPGIVFNNTGRILNDYSFPSGHTSGAFTTATSLTLLYHKWYIVVPSYLWATTVGYSRIQLGAHYTSDVLGGALLGSGTVLMLNKIKR